MNWFTHSPMQHLDTSARVAVAQGCDNLCTHVQKNPVLLHVVSKENDSFGNESSGFCEPCWTKIQHAHRMELVHCYDCSMAVPRHSTIEWKWYDFYPAQGDVALTICTPCQGTEKHARRVAKDEAAYRAEYGIYDEDYD